MEKITELYDAYLRTCEEKKRIDERIAQRRAQIERLEDKRDKIGDWHKNLLHPLAKVLTPLLNCDTYEIYGPFGLRAESSIYFKKNGSTAKSCDYSLHITLHYDAPLHLRYDTYKRNTLYQRGSLGELNGYNKIKAPLPESIEELVKIIKSRKGE